MRRGLAIRLREVLKRNTGSGGALRVRTVAQALGLEPPISLRKLCLEGARRRASGGLIRHLFVLMLENRSFDHILGSSGISGWDPITGQPRKIDGLQEEIWANTDAETAVEHAAGPPAAQAIPKDDGDPGHEFGDVLCQLGGLGAVASGETLSSGQYPPIRLQGFVDSYVRNARKTRGTRPAHPGRVMESFRPEQLPVMNQLAREFAVCDRWFSSMPGPTFPNRFFVHAASSGGMDDSPSSGRIFTSFFDGFDFSNGTIFDRLESHGVEWKVFEGDSTPQVLSLSGIDPLDLANRIEDFDEFESVLRSDDFDARYVFIEPAYAPLHDLSDYGCGTSMHPLNDVSRGERLLKKVYETIRNSSLWLKSALVVVFDEHGGFFDHVPPPAAPPPGDKALDEDDNEHGFRFDRYGVRVPALVISPWVPAATVDHTIYDHTSILATLERMCGLLPLTRRDAAANDFLHLFSEDTPRATPERLVNTVQVVLACEEDDTLDQGIAALTVASAPIDRATTDEEPIDRTQRAFLAIALRRHLALTPARERPAIVEQVRQITTRPEGAAYLRDVHSLVRRMRPVLRTTKPRLPQR